MKRWEIYKVKSDKIKDVKYIKTLDIKTDSNDEFRYELRCLTNEQEVVHLSVTGEDMFSMVFNNEMSEATETDKAKILLGYKEF